jgi:hypothetical protein
MEMLLQLAFFKRETEMKYPKPLVFWLGTFK